MYRPSLKAGLLRVLPFGVLWLLSAAVFLLVEWSAFGGRFPTGDTNIVPDAGILAFALAAMFLLGTIVGYVELYVFRRWLAGTSFSRKLLVKFAIYLVFIHLTVGLTYPLAAAMESGTAPWSPAVWDKLGGYLASTTHLNTVLQLSVIILLTIVYAQVSEVIGHTTLLNYLAGTYHQPIEETRVYMFLDMRSSTAIAERLGHREYFRMLSAYYADLADAVARHGGEVYLYVGDEMIISWKLKDGIANNACLDCFFAMQADLGRRAEWYRRTFGLVPTFKAGMHCGRVTTGEIGVLKRHIMFTGDVLNTAARIQDLCNLAGVDLLISEALLRQLPLGGTYTSRSVGNHELRGKRSGLQLFTVSLRGAQVPSPTAAEGRG